MTRTFLYARVSTDEQAAENQVDEVLRAGFAVERHRVVQETISGSMAAMQRPDFARLVDRLENGDVLIVTKIDRLGRNAVDVRSTIDLLASAGVRVHCLQLGGTDLTSPAGKMVMTVMAAMAEFELDLIRERTQSGLARAREAGKKLGRKMTLSPAQRADIRAQRASGATLGALAKQFGVSRSMVQRIEKAVK